MPPRRSWRLLEGMAHQQVRGGLSRPPLLRRVRARRRGRGPRPRSREGAVRLASAPTCSPTAEPRRTSPRSWRSSIPGDKVLAMSLDHGGHLSHGAREELQRCLLRHPQLRRGPWRPSGSTWTRSRDRPPVRPSCILAGASAYSRIIDFEAFARSRTRWMRSSWRHRPHRRPRRRGAHASPFPHAHIVTMTTHKTLRGPRGGLILCPKDRIAKKSTARCSPAARVAR